MMHKMATVLHPTFKRLSFIPAMDRNDVYSAIRAKLEAMPLPSAEVPNEPPKKKSRLDDGYDMFFSEDTPPVVQDGLDELGRSLRDALAVPTEDLMEWVTRIQGCSVLRSQY